MTSNTHCDQQVLQKLLTESLPEPEESSVANHLAACADCRREFEVMAATADWWQEAMQRLSGSSARKQIRESTSGLSHDDDLLFTTDFAVDFLEPSDDEDSLGRLGEYEISEVIGRGGMGIVLKGFQKELHRHVAVKVLSPHLSTSGAARRRFAREAQATAAIVHPHVMAIHSVNANAKLPYLVMPHVACQSLQDRLDQLGPLELKDILRIGMQAALGLAAAHAQGIVHRDVKPANILLETNVDRVLLTDFGLARAVDDATLTRTGIIAGTPQYMSPEQANGDVVDHRSDLFSLGGVLYAMCTARPPFRAETTFGVLRRIRETEPRSIREINPDIPLWLEQIINRLLAKESSERYGTAQEVAMLLENCLAHVQQPTSVPLPPELTKTGALKHGSDRSVWLRRTLVIAMLLVIVIGASAELLRRVFGPTPIVATDDEDSNQASEVSTLPTEVVHDQPVEALSSPAPVPTWDSMNDELDENEELLNQLEKTISQDVTTDDIERIKQ